MDLLMKFTLYRMFCTTSNAEKLSFSVLTTPFPPCHLQPTSYPLPVLLQDCFNLLHLRLYSMASQNTKEKMEQMTYFHHFISNFHSNFWWHWCSCFSKSEILNILLWLKCIVVVEDVEVLLRRRNDLLLHFLPISRNHKNFSRSWKFEEFYIQMQLKNFLRKTSWALVRAQLITMHLLKISSKKCCNVHTRWILPCS